MLQNNFNTFDLSFSILYLQFVSGSVSHIKTGFKQKRYVYILKCVNSIGLPIYWAKEKATPLEIRNNTVKEGRVQNLTNHILKLS